MAADTANKVLEVEDINVYYGAIHAIKDVSFEVHEGEIVALIGANGAGKSTTLKTFSGLLRSSTGSIEFMGEDIMHVPADKLVERGLAHVPEGRRVFAQMSVEENLEMGAYTRPNSVYAPWGSSASMRTSRASRSAAARLQARFPAASSRCSPWVARS